MARCEAKPINCNHVTTYEYDDYRRVKCLTPPVRDGTHTTQFYYGANPWDAVAITDSPIPM